MSMNLEAMAEIMAENDRELEARDMLPLDAEGKALAEDKRKAFDLPTNAVKVDPLR